MVRTERTVPLGQDRAPQRPPGCSAPQPMLCMLSEPPSLPAAGFTSGSVCGRTLPAAESTRGGLEEEVPRIQQRGRGRSVGLGTLSCC